MKKVKVMEEKEKKKKMKKDKVMEENEKKG